MLEKKTFSGWNIVGRPPLAPIIIGVINQLGGYFITSQHVFPTSNFDAESYEAL